MKGDRTLIILGVVLLALVVAGPLLPQWAMFIVTIAIAKGLVALALMLQCAPDWCPSAGLYYCIGAYSAGSLGRFFGVGDMLLPDAGRMHHGGVSAYILAFCWHVIAVFSTAC